MKNVKNEKTLQNLRITRTTRNQIKITWTLRQDVTEVKIYWSSTPTIREDNEYIIGVTGVDNVSFDDPNPSRRNFFIVKATGYLAEIVAEVIMPFQGINNFRDLGGYKTQDGRRVKWNTFFRSAELAGLTPDDLEYLKSLGVKTIFDYRSKGEVMKRPDPMIEELENINISGMPFLDKQQGNFDIVALLQENTEQLLQDPSAFLKKGYIEMVSSNHAFKTFMECVGDPQKMPIIQHCTAGKDRTGFGSALLLLALGVSEEIVIEDYLLTNQYRLVANHSIMKEMEPLLQDAYSRKKFELMLEARREYLESSLQKIKTVYGSISNYLAQEYGLNGEKIEILQQYYLE